MDGYDKTPEERFLITDFDRHDLDGVRNESCVVDDAQVGADGERLIVGTYPDHATAVEVRDALVRDWTGIKRFGSGINVCITNELARVAGLIAQRHPDRSVQIEWRETSDEREWFITASDGKHDSVYVVDDESGTWMPLNPDELARYSRGESVLAGI